MKILMISTDRTLLTTESGDALSRHLEYAKHAGCIDIIVFSKRNFNERTGDHLIIHPTNSLTKLNYVFDAFKIIKNLNEFDLIVAQDPFLTSLIGWLIKKKFNIPLLIHFHGDFWENKYWLSKPKKWWHLFWYNGLLLILSKFLIKKADGIRVVSSGIKEKLIRAGINKDKIRIIPTPVDLVKFENYDYDRVKEQKKIHENCKTIINVGLRDPWAKDYKTLFKAIDLVCEKYGKIAFWQVGANLRLSDNIKFNNIILSSTYKIEQKELTNYYHASDIYVSSSCNESFGKVLVEAMVCGLPVVATATTGSKDIVVEGENGFLVPIGNSEALAKKIVYLLNNPEIAKKMGMEGQQMVKKRFNREKIIKEIIFLRHKK
ncbi:glycosyltransferase family 4 protein [Patescibacteria group bacterium]